MWDVMNAKTLAGLEPTVPGIVTPVCQCSDGLRCRLSEPYLRYFLLLCACLSPSLFKDSSSASLNTHRPTAEWQFLWMVLTQHLPEDMLKSAPPPGIEPGSSRMRNKFSCWHFVSSLVVNIFFFFLLTQDWERGGGGGQNFYSSCGQLLPTSLPDESASKWQHVV
jgi:hypothetical protein